MAPNERASESFQLRDEPTSNVATPLAANATRGVPELPPQLDPSDLVSDLSDLEDDDECPVDGPVDPGDPEDVCSESYVDVEGVCE